MPISLWTVVYCYPPHRKNSNIKKDGKKGDKTVWFPKLYENKDIPRPDHWGGYLLSPSRIEFWQGRVSRLHDRCLYEQHGEGWKMNRLAP